jgi:hypothetical protein
MEIYVPFLREEIILLSVEAAALTLSAPPEVRTIPADVGAFSEAVTFGKGLHAINAVKMMVSIKK